MSDATAKPLWELGELNDKEARSAEISRERELANGMPPNLHATEIAVAVYVNGRLRFHGGSCIGTTEHDALGQSDVRAIALGVLRGMATGHEEHRNVNPIVG